jgi:hypothetical protein
MTVNEDPHNTEEHRAPLLQLFIINPATGTQRPFDGSVKDLLIQYPEYTKAKAVLYASSTVFHMYFYEPGSEVPDD